MAYTNLEIERTPYNIRHKLFEEFPTVAQALVNVMNETHGRACGCRSCLNTQEGILYRQLLKVPAVSGKLNSPDFQGWEIGVGVDHQTDRLDVQFGAELKEYLFN